MNHEAGNFRDFKKIFDLSLEAQDTTLIQLRRSTEEILVFDSSYRPDSLQALTAQYGFVSAGGGKLFFTDSEIFCQSHRFKDNTGSKYTLTKAFKLRPSPKYSCSSHTSGDGHELRVEHGETGVEVTAFHFSGQSEHFLWVDDSRSVHVAAQITDRSEVPSFVFGEMDTTCCVCHFRKQHNPDDFRSHAGGSAAYEMSTSRTNHCAYEDPQTKAVLVHLADLILIDPEGKQYVNVTALFPYLPKETLEDLLNDQREISDESLQMQHSSDDTESRAEDRAEYELPASPTDYCIYEDPATGAVLVFFSADLVTHHEGKPYINVTAMLPHVPKETIIALLNSKGQSEVNHESLLVEHSTSDCEIDTAWKGLAA